MTRMSSSISRLMNFVGYIRMNCHSYLSLAESLPNYGVHYYQVKDKRNIRWWLGISYQGIAQYDYTDRTQPRRVSLTTHQMIFYSHLFVRVFLFLVCLFSCSLAGIHFLFFDVDCNVMINVA